MGNCKYCKTTSADPSHEVFVDKLGNEIKIYIGPNFIQNGRNTEKRKTIKRATLITDDINNIRQNIIVNNTEDNKTSTVISDSKISCVISNYRPSKIIENVFGDNNQCLALYKIRRKNEEICEIAYIDSKNQNNLVLYDLKHDEKYVEENVHFMKIFMVKHYFFKELNRNVLLTVSEDKSIKVWIVEPTDNNAISRDNQKSCKGLSRMSTKLVEKDNEIHRVSKKSTIENISNFSKTSQDLDKSKEPNSITNQTSRLTLSLHIKDCHKGSNTGSIFCLFIDEGTLHVLGFVPKEKIRVWNGRGELVFTVSDFLQSEVNYMEMVSISFPEEEISVVIGGKQCCQSYNYTENDLKIFKDPKAKTYNCTVAIVSEINSINNLICGDDLGIIRIFAYYTKELIKVINLEVYTYSLAQFNENYLLVSGAIKRLKIIDIEKYNVMFKSYNTHQDYITNIRTITDNEGNIFYITSGKDQIIEIWLDK